MNAVLNQPKSLAQTPPGKRSFTVSDYHHIGSIGVLDSDERVELIEGEIITMSPIGSPHAGVVSRLTHIFVTLFDKRAQLSPQNPVIVHQRGEPQPDITLLKWTDDFYTSATPTPRDVLLVAEVGDSTVSRDRRVKGPMYAQANIKEFWLVNIPDRCVEVYRRPSQMGYRSKQILNIGDTLTLLAFPGVELAVKDVFGA